MSDDKPDYVGKDAASGAFSAVNSKDARFILIDAVDKISPEKLEEVLKILEGSKFTP